MNALMTVIVFYLLLSAVHDVTSFLYNQLTIVCPAGDKFDNYCAINPPNLTMTQSKGYCSSACNRLPGCRWFNFFEPKECNKLKSCDIGKCQLFSYRPSLVVKVDGCTLWQREHLSNPVTYQSPCQTANCSIAAQSCNTMDSAGCTPTTASLTLNGHVVYSVQLCQVSAENSRGVNVFAVDAVSCSVLNQLNFDTYGSNAESIALANYLTSAATGTLLVAISADEAQTRISPAVSALATVCNVDVSSMVYRGSFAFVCHVGFPTKTKWRLLPPQIPGAYVSAVVSGTLLGGGGRMVIT